MPIRDTNTNMNASEKSVRKPCETVLEWILAKDDAVPAERIAAETILEHGLNGQYQEKTLATACTACGMRAECPYASECGIGDGSRQHPAIPADRLVHPFEIDTGSAYVSNAD